MSFSCPLGTYDRRYRYVPCNRCTTVKKLPSAAVTLRRCRFLARPRQRTLLKPIFAFDHPDDVHYIRVCHAFAALPCFGRLIISRSEPVALAFDRHVRGAAAIPLLSLGQLMHHRVSLAFFVLRRAWVTAGRGVHECSAHARSVPYLYPVAGEMPSDCRQTVPALLVLFEQVEKFKNLGLIGHSILAQIDFHNASHRHHIVTGFLHRGIREIEPRMQEIHMQHSIQSNRKSTVAAPRPPRGIRVTPARPAPSTARCAPFPRETFRTMSPFRTS